MEFLNPFRPGAGHPPPHLAGRDKAIAEFRKLLRQDVILENAVITGLRGVGKTVLADKLKPIAIQEGWLWVGDYIAEAATESEANLATRILTDLSAVTGQIEVVQEHDGGTMSFRSEPMRTKQHLNFDYLKGQYEQTPGLVADKLRSVLEGVAHVVRTVKKRGVIFAYDEAQNLADHAADRQHPLSVLLDVFQSIQRKQIPFMLLLTGLPTLFPKLVEARTYSERMFHIIDVGKLDEADSRQAIIVPMQNAGFVFTDESVDLIVEASGGYPYFIQFICREAFDAVSQNIVGGEPPKSIELSTVIQKLDRDFFDGGWSKVAERQRDVLEIAAALDTSDAEFTVAEIAEKSKSHDGGRISPSHVNQMLASLCKAGFVYRNRHGKYSFALPMLRRYIIRRARSTL
jgi:broad-specificity NMP kinase